jgi:beta-galactosidase
LVNTPADLYFGRHPLYITTRQNRFVSLSAEFTNRTKAKEIHMHVMIYDPDGNLVAETTGVKKRNPQTRTLEMQVPEMEIANAQLWDTESPKLYKAVAQLLREDGSIADEYAEHFGIRTIEIGPEYGLKLNGKKVLLKGYANHHTLGALGAAAYPRAIEKRLQLMKQFGMNHVRTSHNPYSRSFIECCDRLGILVVDELYDKWTLQHTGGRVPFMNHWAQDVTEWVKRDRNSPSVVLWSLGNELQQDPNQPFNDFGVTCYKMMRPVLQRYDSTRLVTVAMHPRYRNWETDSLPCDLAMQTDVQAYNYRYMYFPGDGRRFPWMTFYQSEASTAAMGPNYFEMNLDKVIGLAYWGAIDYLGESQGWPAKGWAQGVFDISLNAKPKAYFMKSFFTDNPMVRLSVMEDKNAGVEWNGIITGTDRQSELWNRPEGSKANLVIYTNCDEVELVLNGKSLGRRNNPKDAKSRNKITWNGIDYKKGRLEAIGYRGSKAVARHALETTGKSVKIIAEPDNSQWHADGMDLQHIRLRAVDAKGRTVLTCQDELTFAVSGDAQIVAVTNGDINSNELNATNHRSLWQGQAMVILRAGTVPSNITLKTSSTKFKQLTTKLETK